MTGLVLDVAGLLCLIWAATFVHQFGHYATGRWLVGVPSSEIRLPTLPVPGAVALRDDDGWVQPTEFQRFRAAYESHDPGYEDFERYVAGGEIIQVLVVVPLALAVGLGGSERVAEGLLLASMTVPLVAVVADAVRTARSGEPSGDYSALWRVSRRVPALLMVGFLSLHLAVLFFIS